jgi:hypothetical protein
VRQYLDGHGPTAIDNQWLETLAKHAAIVISLDLSLFCCEQVSDDGFRALAGLTALTVSDGGAQVRLHTPAGNLLDGGPLPPAGSSAGGFACDPLQLWPCFG